MICKRNTGHLDIITVYRYNICMVGDEIVINAIMEKKSITKYRLAKNSEVPYTTISDICNGKTQLEKCSAETVYRIAKELDVPMEYLLEPYFEERCTFDLFKSNVCHRLKEIGDIAFIIEVLEKDDIRKYYDRKWHPESLYLLAMLDYLSRLNDVPLCTRYADLRACKLQKTIYPSSVLIAATVSLHKSRIKEEARRASIPEFIRFNIVESEVRNVI